MINELSSRTGVSAKSIRFYEQSGVLPGPRRLSNGYRVYGEKDVDRLKLVAGARRLLCFLLIRRPSLHIKAKGSALVETLVEKILMPLRQR